MADRTEGRSTLSYRFQAAAGFHGGATVLCCVSLATVYWLQGLSQGFLIRLGIWKGCVDEECVYIWEADGIVQKALGGGWTVAVQACISIGFGLLCLGALLMTCFIVSQNLRSYKIVLQILAGIVIAGGVLCLYSEFLYVYETHKTRLHYGFSLYLGTASAIMSLASAVYYLLEHKHVSSPRYLYTRLDGYSYK